jgi:hypothetical protein
MFVSLGKIAMAPADEAGRRRSLMPKRTGEPVHRHSRTKGHCEGVFWRPTSRQDVRRIVDAAKRYELAGRQPGARVGPLGSVALEVLEYLANLVSYKTGRLDPALETIMRRVKRSKDAVHRALKALRDHGFLDWLRRYEPTGNEGRGPQVKQASNAYRLSLPAAAARLLGRQAEPPPAPDDDTALRERVAAGVAAYRASLAPVAYVAETVEDPALREILERLGRHVQQRESGGQTESGDSYLFYRD